jgi:hypothetical protein
MTFSRFLMLTVALAPTVAMAGPLDDLLGAALKAAAGDMQGGGQKQTSTSAQFQADNPRRQAAIEIMEREFQWWDFKKGDAVEVFCADVRRGRVPSDLPYYQDCESTYREKLAQEKSDREAQATAQKEAEEKRLAAQQEDERKSAVEAEKQRAAIAASGVSVEKAAEMAGEMYQAYRYGGISEMLSMENACWSALAKQKKANETGATSCSVAALAGAFVEATYARQQRRGSAPAYNGDMFRQRLIGNMAKAGIREDRAQRVLELSTAHQGSVLLGLMNAGMR